MKIKFIKYKAKDGSIKKVQYAGEDGTGYYVLLGNRKRPKHIKFNQVISTGEEE